MSSRKESYTTDELGEIADGLQRLLDTIADGDVTASSATIRRLEGAWLALDALTEGRGLAVEDFTTRATEPDNEGAP